LHLFFFIFSLQSSTIDACPPQADSMFKGTCHWLLVSDHWPLIQFILPEARSLEQKRLPHALCPLFQQSEVRNLYPVKSPQSGARIAKFNRAGPKLNTPSFFTTFWGFFPQMGKVMINANLDNYLHYFGDLRVFLKTSATEKER
jgi:hypothetical protein